VRALVDTSALVALSRSQDQYHAAAVRIARAHLAAGGRFVGTTLILGEFHSHLLYLRGPEEARQALRSLLKDPAHAWTAVAAGLVAAAVDRWFSGFKDQNFSLVDAVSFELMRSEKLTSAFAFDQHFRIAGFSLLE
jgi:uncharacterized protein